MELEAKLRQHVYCLAEHIGERNVFCPHELHAAAAYLRKTWETQGYAVVSQDYRVRKIVSSNLEVTQKGSRAKQPCIIVGAHYDSVMGSPGANDNASGVAVLLELSCLFRSIRPRRSVRFVAFVNEEPPFFYSNEQGSRFYAESAKQNGDQIDLMIALETIGYYCGERGSQRYPPLFRFFYPDTAHFVAFVANLSSRRVLRKFKAAFQASTDFPVESVASPAFVPGVGWSDHASFWAQGYRALMITDTAFYRYPFYHSAEDTPEKLDYKKLAQLTQGLFRALCLLDERYL